MLSEENIKASMKYNLYQVIQLINKKILYIHFKIKVPEESRCFICQFDDQFISFDNFQQFIFNSDFEIQQQLDSIVQFPSSHNHLIILNQAVKCRDKYYFLVNNIIYEVTNPTQIRICCQIENKPKINNYCLSTILNKLLIILNEQLYEIQTENGQLIEFKLFDKFYNINKVISHYQVANYYILTVLKDNFISINIFNNQNLQLIKQIDTQSKSICFLNNLMFYDDPKRGLLYYDVYTNQSVECNRLQQRLSDNSCFSLSNNGHLQLTNEILQVICVNFKQFQQLNDLI